MITRNKVVSALRWALIGNLLAQTYGWGISIYVISLCWGGWVQGSAWVAGKPFMDSVRSTTPFMVWRFVGGLLMTASHVIFFLNLLKMRPGAFLAMTKPS